MKRHILVADDEEALLQLVSNFLRRRGFQVTTTSTADETLQVIQNVQIHLIILDLLWPDADGMELLETVKSLRPDLKIIIITGLGLRDDLVKETRERGAIGYISKAFSLDDLMQEVRRVLNTDRQSHCPDLVSEKGA